MVNLRRDELVDKYIKVPGSRPLNHSLVDGWENMISRIRREYVFRHPRIRLRAVEADSNPKSG